MNLWGASGLVCPIMDARRKQVYTGIYRFGGEMPEIVCGQMAVPIEELLDRLMELEGKVTFLGDGVQVFREQIEERLPGRAFFAPAHLIKQRAGAVAVRGLQLLREGKAVDAAMHRPDYLRVSQAERERAARIAADEKEKR